MMVLTNLFAKVQYPNGMQLCEWKDTGTSFTQDLPIGIVLLAKKKQSTTFAGSRIECPEKQKHDFGNYK